jgi:5,10-methenyltetrahydrofolate synthetase
VRISDGQPLFTVPIGAYTGASVALQQGQAFFGTFNNEVMALDLKSKKMLWKYTPKDRQFPFYSSAALADGKVVCYPLSHVHGRILSFRAISGESELEPGRLGVREPSTSSELVPVDAIDLFVVPGLGFGRDGKRLGRGGGYYDATLRAASDRSRRVGLAFAEQMVDTLPVNAEDVEMDLVVTESESFRGLFRQADFLDT